MQEFITESLQRTDDSAAPELEVLGNPRPERKARHHHTYVETASHSTKADKTDKSEEDDQDDQDDQDDEQEDDGEDGPKGEALLAVAAQVRRSTNEASLSSESEMPATADGDSAEANPKDLLAVLSKGVTDLQQEERASEGRLKTMFLSNFQAGAKRHAALTAQQKQLNATRTQLRELWPRLHAADERLDRSHGELERRLRGLGLFAQRLPRTWRWRL